MAALSLAFVDDSVSWFFVVIGYLRQVQGGVVFFRANHIIGYRSRKVEVSLFLPSGGTLKMTCPNTFRSICPDSVALASGGGTGRNAVFVAYDSSSGLVECLALSGLRVVSEGCCSAQQKSVRNRSTMAPVSYGFCVCILRFCLYCRC